MQNLYAVFYVENVLVSVLPHVMKQMRNWLLWNQQVMILLKIFKEVFKYISTDIPSTSTMNAKYDYALLPV